MAWDAARFKPQKLPFGIDGGGGVVSGEGTTSLFFAGRPALPKARPGSRGRVVAGTAKILTG